VAGSGRQALVRQRCGVGWPGNGTPWEGVLGDVRQQYCQHDCRGDQPAVYAPHPRKRDITAMGRVPAHRELWAEVVGGLGTDPRREVRQ
jgi:hypothetical protein